MKNFDPFLRHYNMLGENILRKLIGKTEKNNTSRLQSHTASCPWYLANTARGVKEASLE